MFLRLGNCTEQLPRSPQHGENAEYVMWWILGIIAELCETGWLVGRVVCYWPSPAQSFLFSVSSRSMTKIFILFYTCICAEMGLPLRRGSCRSFYI
jgi:hypothetical protein